MRPGSVSGSGSAEPAGVGGRDAEAVRCYRGLIGQAMGEAGIAAGGVSAPGRVEDREDPDGDGARRARARDATIERLARYAALVERWSARHNLVSFGSREELVRRHLVESLAGLAVIGSVDGRLLDVGSGAGLPGVPILIASPRQGILVEPRAKRWSFLRMVARELGLDCEVVRARYEQLGGRYRGLAVVTARAVGRSRELLAWARPRLDPGGMVLLWTDAEREREIGDLEGWHVLSSRIPGREGGRLIQLRSSFT